MAFDNLTRVTGYCSYRPDLKHGCNVWAKTDNFINKTYTGSVDADAPINTFLNNDYYNKIDDDNKQLIQIHDFNYGAAQNDGDSNFKTSLEVLLSDESKYTWNGYIGLISPSEYYLANSDTKVGISDCGTPKGHSFNNKKCKDTNYLTPTVDDEYFTISATKGLPYSNLYVKSDGRLYNLTSYSEKELAIRPVLYLKSSVILTGDGTIDNPYVPSLKKEVAKPDTDSTVPDEKQDKVEENNNTITKVPETGDDIILTFGIAIISITSLAFLIKLKH